MEMKIEITPEPSSSWIASVMMYLEPITTWIASVMMYLEPYISWIALLIAVYTRKKWQKKQHSFDNTLQRKIRDRIVLEEANATALKCSLQIGHLSSSLSIPCPVSLEDLHKINTLLQDTVVAYLGIVSLLDSADLSKALSEPGRLALNGATREELVSAWRVFLRLLTGEIFDKLEKLARE